MPKANFKRLIFILLSLTLLGVIGCSGPEEKKNDSLRSAEALRAEGQLGKALSVLEDLAAEHPNDPEILQQIGHIFEEQGDTTMAAFFLEQAHQLAPEDLELLYKTYLALKAADQPTAPLLEKLASQSEESMTPELWVRLGQLRADQNLTQSALDAYLKGVDPEKEAPSAETAVAIGNLFIDLDNTAQAERWFTGAAENDSPDALTALFGLLEIKLLQKDWEAASSIIERLDKQFPGAVDASKWSSARTDLIRWRAAQEAMRAELAKAEAAKQAAAEKAEQEKTTVTATVATVASDSPTEAELSEGKAQIIADMEAAESLATTPATEVVDASITTDSPSAIEESRNAISFNPSVAIEPAEPDLTFSVTYDQQGSVETSYTVESTQPATVVETTVTEAVTPALIEPARPVTRPRTVEELLDQANAATVDKNYRLAISNYWQALGQANDRDDIWNLLSRMYLVDGQLQNAETTALEAIRLAPREINYTLDYLRVAQRSKTSTEFFAELETAYDRFPQSPEVTLSLARGYERISKNNFAASTLYQRFIDLAPSHPLRPEAEAAIARLR
jgi:tetratricopeptide (TPR) repeat protein